MNDLPREEPPGAERDPRSPARFDGTLLAAAPAALSQERSALTRALLGGRPGVGPSTFCGRPVRGPT